MKEIFYIAHDFMSYGDFADEFDAYFNKGFSNSDDARKYLAELDFASILDGRKHNYWDGVDSRRTEYILIQDSGATTPENIVYPGRRYIHILFLDTTWLSEDDVNEFRVLLKDSKCSKAIKSLIFDEFNHEMYKTFCFEVKSLIIED